MFLVEIVFEQRGVWSTPYTYTSKHACKDHVVAAAGRYLAVGYVVSCKPLPPGTNTAMLKSIYGPVSYEYL